MAGFGKSVSTNLATIRFFSSVFACAWSGCCTGKIFFHTPGNRKVFLQCVFACALSGCCHRKIFFHTLGNEIIFLHYVSTCNWSSCGHGEIVFHTPGNNVFFFQIIFHVFSKIRVLHEKFSALMATKLLFSSYNFCVLD